MSGVEVVWWDNKGIVELVVCVFLLLYFFFFKQKTAYEIVSRDWSSDVCSSDLISHDLMLN